MSMLKRLAVCAAMFTAAPALAQSPQFGQPIAPADIAPWDISIGPDGAGLPPGRGTARQGETVYAAKCQACHGEKGAGGPNDALVGGIGSLAPDKPPVKTVGSYWPYATTLFDYVRRAMPFQEPKSLTNDEVYAVSAYILNLNGIVGTNDVLDAQSLPKVKNAEPRRVHPVPAQSKIACPGGARRHEQLSPALLPRHGEIGLADGVRLPLKAASGSPEIGLTTPLSRRE